MQTDSNPPTTYVGKHRGRTHVGRSGIERNLAKHTGIERRQCASCSPVNYALHHAKHKAVS